MSPRTFFRLALLMPIATPPLLLPFGTNIFATLLYMSLIFGGVQYIVFALVLFIVIGKLKVTKQIKQLMYWAPLMYLPFQAIGWFAFSHLQDQSSLGLIDTWSALLPFVVYSLLIGYAYVGLALLLSLLLVSDPCELANHRTVRLSNNKKTP